MTRMIAMKTLTGLLLAMTLAALNPVFAEGPPSATSGEDEVPRGKVIKHGIFEAKNQGHIEKDAAASTGKVIRHPTLELIEQITARPLQIQREEDQKGDMRDTFADTTAARRDLGFQPAVGLAEGLAREWEWLGEGA